MCVCGSTPQRGWRPGLAIAQGGEVGWRGDFEAVVQPTNRKTVIVSGSECATNTGQPTAYQSHPYTPPNGMAG